MENSRLREYIKNIERKFEDKVEDLRFVYQWGNPEAPGLPSLEREVGGLRRVLTILYHCFPELRPKRT